MAKFQVCSLSRTLTSNNAAFSLKRKVIKARGGGVLPPIDAVIPPIDAEEQFKKHGMKELYVFRHPTDPSCPIVMHFVMVNLTFREESAPGKNLLKSLIQLLKYVLSKIF